MPRILPLLVCMTGIVGRVTQERSSERKITQDLKRTYTGDEGTASVTIILSHSSELDATAIIVATDAQGTKFYVAIPARDPKLVNE